jgi:predicted small secreted protein
MKRIRIRLVIAVLGTAAAVSLLSSCHTAAGLGQDMQDAGRGMERSVNRAR